MIEVKRKFSIARYYAKKVYAKDLIIPAIYEHYIGKKTPFLYRKETRLTNVIDLTQELNVILANMKSNTRNEIRRAEKEGCECTFDGSIDEFVPFYNDFSKQKGLGKPINNTSLLLFDDLLISKAVYNGKVLAMHATALDKQSKIAMLLYSCSTRLSDDVDKKLIGWANRYLHYKELEYLKNDRSFGVYDWNGICLDPNQPEKYNIGIFKQAFGGMNRDNVWLYSPLYRLGDYLKKLI